MSPWISLRNGKNGLIDADIGNRLSHKVSAVGPPEPAAGCVLDCRPVTVRSVTTCRDIGFRMRTLPDLFVELAFATPANMASVAGCLLYICVHSLMMPDCSEVTERAHSCSARTI